MTGGTPSKTRLDQLLSIPEMDVKGKKKDYPSINDYYKAASRGEKPITYQHGLSNFSSVQLGDDRISFKKSLSQDAFSQEIQAAEPHIHPASNNKSIKQRREDYEEANEIVGLNKLDEMEQMMRDKLQQRTKTGPFQLRKTFKYFDRDGSGGIDFSEFQLAMELMGFQFTEIQQLALFGRYDESCNGEVDYNDFVEKVMESDFKVVHASAVKKNKENLGNMISSVFAPEKEWKEEKHYGEEDDSDLEDNEEEVFRRREVKKMFDFVDKDGSRYIDKKEFITLVKGLGKDFRTEEDLHAAYSRIDHDMSGRIEFDEFYEWFKHIRQTC